MTAVTSNWSIAHVCALDDSLGTTGRVNFMTGPEARLITVKLARLEFGRIGGTIATEKCTRTSMKLRIAIWASTGFLVAGFWALFAFATFPSTAERMRDVWLSSV